jgi:carbon-monoxide dehydrogenase large subunit
MEPKTYVLNIYVGTRKTRIQLSDDGQRRMQSTFKIKEEEKGARAQRLYVGSRVLRVEDTRLITGKDQFLDNLKFPNMVFAGFVRSPYPHAKIKRIDTSKIRDDPSVVGILTPEEVMTISEPIPVLWRVGGANLHEHYALAQSKVLHVGDPVLAVAVDQRNKLEDVLENVEVEYEALEPVLDPKRAFDSPPIHEEFESNECFTLKIESGNISEALNTSDVTVSGDFKISRLSASPMETRGVIANPCGVGGELTIYSSTQWPHVLRTLLSTCLKFDENKLRVVGPDVGGGFGVKGELYSEEVAISLLALKIGRPVKWVESRSESFIATTHARDQTIHARASFMRDGTITGLDVNILCDLGAYLHTITPGCAFITAISLNGPYVIRNLRVEARAVYTNKVSLSAYRGFGQPEAAFVVERLMSIASKKLGIDQSEIRFKNLIPPTEMPYKNASGGIYDSGDYPSCLRRALDLADYDEIISRKKGKTAATESEGEAGGKLRGVGVSIFTEATGFAPGFVFKHLGLEIGGYDSATVKLDPHGKVLATTGAFPHGQGFNTSLSQICADELGVDIDDVYVFHGDTRVSPYGQGSFGSRTVAVAGSAAVLACRKLKGKILELASYLLGAREGEELYLSNGFVRSRSSPDKCVSLAELAKAAYKAHDIPKTMEPALEATAYFQPEGLATSCAAHVCEVEVDRETGLVRILKYVSVHDCGKEINPMIVEGQIHGSIVQAIGACFLEEVLYAESGQILSDSFMNYLLPTAEFSPRLVLSESSSNTNVTRINPLGAKGIGESGTIIAPPAIVNAVSDALGVEINQIPITPERLWEAYRQSKNK